MSNNVIRPNATNNRLDRINRMSAVVDHRVAKQAGKGKYLYQNSNKDASLSLPKPAVDEHGRPLPHNEVPPNGKFIGDDYFMMLMKPGTGQKPEIRLVEVLEQPVAAVAPVVVVVTPTPAPVKKEEETMPEETLILDQPDIVNTGGKVEHKVAKLPHGMKKLNEQPLPDEKKHDVLLTDTPAHVDGVEILN